MQQMTTYQVLLCKQGWVSPQTAAPYFLKSTIYKNWLKPAFTKVKASFQKILSTI